MQRLVKLVVLPCVTVLLVSWERGEARFFFSAGSPLSVEAVRLMEVHTTRWHRGWVISADRKNLKGFLQRDYEGHVLEKGEGDILSLRAFDEGDPDAIDDEICLIAWFAVPPVEETELPLELTDHRISAKVCSCAWGVCGEVAANGRVHLISVTDAGVTAEVVMWARPWRINDTATFSLEEPDQAFTESSAHTER